LHGIGDLFCSKTQVFRIFLIDAISTIQHQRGTIPLS
jgi:hypothetical protein